ncbi:MAG: winged helix-turn-helix domain-containing protein [Candidatus Jordarchaeaceae archaeon]
MILKLQLVQDDKVIIEIPLSSTEWSKEKFENEFSIIEEKLKRFSRIFEAISNETRLKMIKKLLEEEDKTINFADFMRELELNPKLVWENARKLTEGGFIKKTGRGEYSFSKFGEIRFMIISLALRHLMEALEEFKTT